MSSLQRYRKPGGFLQLVALIETFGPQKKEKFLEMIEGESPVWARALREKMLTFNRIFSWPEQVIIEVFKNLPPKTMAFALQALKEEQRGKIMAFFSHAEKRKIEEMIAESNPKPEELASVMVKVVEHCRAMLKGRELHADKFDETLLVAEDFEVQLEERAAHEQFKAMSAEDPGMTAPTAAKPSTAPAKAPAAVSAPAAVAAGTVTQPSPEVIVLQRKVAQLLKENKALREELVAAKDKLDKIRKIGKAV
jgi:outer membrane murein-binding lipoprotein Lpp